MTERNHDLLELIEIKRKYEELIAGQRAFAERVWKACSLHRTRENVNDEARPNDERDSYGFAEYWEENEKP